MDGNGGTREGWEFTPAITRSLREDVERIGFKEIKLSLLEKILDAKMLEYCVPKARPIYLHRPLFKTENGLNLFPNALKVLRKRYLRKDEGGKVIETPDEMSRRVAHRVALAELNYPSADQAEEIEEAFYRLMNELKFLPNSPTVMNAGTE